MTPTNRTLIALGHHEHRRIVSINDRALNRWELGLEEPGLVLASAITFACQLISLGAIFLVDLSLYVLVEFELFHVVVVPTTLSKLLGPTSLLFLRPTPSATGRRRSTCPFDLDEAFNDPSPRDLAPSDVVSLDDAQPRPHVAMVRFLEVVVGERFGGVDARTKGADKHMESEIGELAELDESTGRLDDMARIAGRNSTG